MLIVKCVRSLKGCILFSATGGFIERFINLLTRHGINVWDMRKEQEIFYFNCLARDYITVARLAKKAQVKTKYISKSGVIFLLKRYKKRVGILIGCLIFILGIMVMQNFIWTIDVVGNKEIATEEILKKVEDLGIRKGRFIPSLNFKNIQQQAIVELEGVSWIAINNVGSKVSVEISEAVKAPEIDKDITPKNIKAKRTGTIVKMNVFEGKSMVKIGDNVVEGDIIVSGVYEDSLGNTLIKSSRAEITARTEYDASFEIPFLKSDKVYAGKEKNRYILNLFGLRFPLYLAFEVKGEYDLSSHYKPLELFGIQLPLGFYVNNYKFYKTENVSLNEDQARERLQTEMEDYEKNNFDGISIVDREVFEEITDDKLVVKIRYICEEDIALEEDISLS